MSNKKFVILYVEDDQDLIDAMKLVLEKNGYELRSARTGEEGLRCYKSAQPDLVIVDLMMEEVDAGAHLVKELRALGNKLPVYMLSSMSDNLSMTTDYNELGLAGVFQKPINYDQLLKVLKSKLG
ncbi:MAG: Response regulator MprA [Phycisphaerae bacterium]|nr:Response regulator MprA [Phycisphaerae bacterium]